MSFGTNLQYLRKKNEMTQEALAEALAVSRQSVSKWESDGAYPEMEKLLALCELFSCTLDDLVRGDLTAHAVEAPTEIPVPPPEKKDSEAARLYDKHMNSRALLLAAGAGLLALSVYIYYFLSGVLRLLAEPTPLPSKVYAAIALILALLALAGSVICFAVAARRHRRFRRAYPRIDDPYTEEERRMFDRRFPLFIVCPLIVMLMGLFWAIAIPLLNAFIGIGGIFYLVWCLCFFVMVLSIPVIVWACVQKQKHNIKAYEKAAEKLLHTKK